MAILVDSFSFKSVHILSLYIYITFLSPYLLKSQREVEIISVNDFMERIQFRVFIK